VVYCWPIHLGAVLVWHQFILCGIDRQPPFNAAIVHRRYSSRALLIVTLVRFVGFTSILYVFNLDIQSTINVFSEIISS
jgi:hypothetical protein